MNVFEGLQPEEVWYYFNAICKVPRPSKKEAKIIAFLMNFGKENKLETKRDTIGNVIIKKPSVPGKENLPTLILQSHMDMVCEKNSKTIFDFDKDVIRAYVDNEWVKAEGTTLGADDGIGMAAQLAILASSTIQHGPLECLFTVDEETGLTGAFELGADMLTGKTLLNLDSEDEGEVFIGCAGGADLVATFYYIKDEVPENSLSYMLSVSGLIGGHSGDEIHKGHGNAIKILNRILWYGTYYCDLCISGFNGGNLRNAIAREAFAIVTIPEHLANSFSEYFELFSKQVTFELQENAPDLKLGLETTLTPDFVIDTDTQHQLINALYACPHGVFAMSYKLQGLVETSTNLASVKFCADDCIRIGTSQRSSIESSKTDIQQMVESVFISAGADIEKSAGYPGWSPNPDSAILKVVISSYHNLFGGRPAVKAIHAGLECGLFLKKYPDLDMISFGPTLRGVHSPDEKLNIPSVEKWWKHLVHILENIPT